MACNGDWYTGYAFFLQQAGQHFTRWSTHQAQRITIAAQPMHHAGNIDTSASGMALHGIAAQLAGGMNMPRTGRHIERGVHRDCKNVRHQREEYHAPKEKPTNTCMLVGCV
jgi:hypothetical protein